MSLGTCTLCQSVPAWIEMTEVPGGLPFPLCRECYEGLEASYQQYRECSVRAAQ